MSAYDPQDASGMPAPIPGDASGDLPAVLAPPAPLATPFDAASEAVAAGATPAAAPPTSSSPVPVQPPNTGSAPLYPPYPNPYAPPPYPYAYPAPPPYPGYPPTPGYSAPPPPAAAYPYYPYPPAVPAFAAPQATGPVPGTRRRPGYLFAAIGCVAALIAYFGLPLFVFSFKVSDSSPSLNFGYSYSFTASELTSSPLSSLSLGSSATSTLISLFWLVPILTILGLIAAVALPFTSLTANRSAHVLTAIVFQLGAAGVAAIVLVGTLQLRDQMNNSLSSLSGLSGISSTSVGYSYSFDLGYGLYVLLGGFGLLVVGGILVLARGDRPTAPAPAA